MTGLGFSPFFALCAYCYLNEAEDDTGKGKRKPKYRAADVVVREQPRYRSEEYELRNRP